MTRIVFNDVLRLSGFDPSTVRIMRHNEALPGNALQWIAAENPAAFNAFQSSHNSGAEATLRSAEFAASFITTEDRHDVFAGLFRIAGYKEISKAAFLAHPDQQILFDLGYAFREWREGTLWFDLQPLSELSDYVGRLAIEWDGQRNYMRRAENRDFEIVAIFEESAFTRPIGDWRELVVTWAELAILPRSWRDALSQWRGIYFIHDKSDGKGYVGSAAGSDNILGRWRDYAKTGHGGNRDLMKRRPETLSFSILERLSPDTPEADVILAETRWKRRLHTYRPHGMNLN